MPGLASARESAAAAVGDTRAQRLYWDDVWTWSREQAAALRRRDLEAVDWENVIEEIEDVGNRHSDAWTSLCGNVIEHLLKMEHSHHERSLDHWRKEILAWRRKMFTVLKRHRGMKGKLDVMLDEAWEDGRGDAVDRLVDHAHPPNRAAEKALRRSWERTTRSATARPRAAQAARAEGRGVPGSQGRTRTCLQALKPGRRRPGGRRPSRDPARSNGTAPRPRPGTPRAPSSRTPGRTGRASGAGTPEAAGRS
ncbi:MAG: DUF29 domain-containing protein [Bryobacterales bacterium]|nr:DUF29 domain-containing protein [Bryobacterales bacterium]